MKPGASDTVLKIAAELSLGKHVQKPRFGIMGKIVQKLGLFEETKSDFDTSNRAQIAHSYQGPVQVFNGPVYFGAAPTTFFQHTSKRPRELFAESLSPKRRLLEKKEDTFSNN